ncbi:parallel beta helix pectate lyase-like protein [Micromonospora endolithica]|nr:parallel beta helix pectate lyase-like protein [Micromonospora endolithica]
MTGNLEAGFHVSAKGTTNTAGRGGLVSDCVIDGNVRDGISIGNTPGPYTVRGNRISGNGRHGYHQSVLGGTENPVAEEIVVESNDIYGNSGDGIRIDRPVRDLFLVGNRIRNNGRQWAPATTGHGSSVRYGETTLVDQRATWPHDGHRGKVLRVGRTIAVVAANDETTLTLAPIRPGSHVAWSGAVPEPASAYELPPSPPVRAGITIDAAVDFATIRGNRVWDNRAPSTQDHGLWITEQGSCVDCRVEDNDFAGNAGPAILLDTPPVGGRWDRNHGDDPD